MAQSTITNYFANRKRPAVDDLKSSTTKIMALDSDTTSTGYGRVKSSENPSQPASRIKVEATVIFASDETSKAKPQTVAASTTPKPKTPARTTRRATKAKDTKQPGMEMFLQRSKATSQQDVNSESSPMIPVSDNVKEEIKVECNAPNNDNAPSATNVKEEINIPVTVVKEESNSEGSSVNVSKKKESVESSVPIVTIKVEGPAQSPSKLLAERKESSVDKARRELSLGDIRSKLTRSARLAELKASLARFDEGREKLKKIEEAKKEQKDSNAPPQLTQFNSIELEVPASPAKSPMKSPMKSPLKGPAGSRSPAFQRYSSLAQAGAPALPLPYSYRHLAELFRCVDTVASLLFNRKEVITFRKLQPAVQEMSRKSFTTSQLAQILTVFPEAYTLKQEKIHNFGTPSKQDKYQLVISPVVLPNSDDHGSPSMTPSYLLERRRQFFKNLLDIVKGHHKDFLQSLDPPINVPMDALTRWHPEFPVDQVPEITPTPLPQPPNLIKCSSAKDVLAKSRDLYSCNARMEKALESVAQSNSSSAVPTVNVQIVNPPATTNPPTSPFKSMQLSSALKGIPKALLEKIRAKQAAKAMEAMTRTPAQDKEAVQYSRLPELARILRNVFVAEKKSALQLDTVLEKVGNSCRTLMSQRELEEHLRLLEKSVPGWLTFEHLLKTDYLRLSKKADMSRVMKRLNDLANNKHGTTC